MKKRIVNFIVAIIGGILGAWIFTAITPKPEFVAISMPAPQFIRLEFKETEPLSDSLDVVVYFAVDSTSDSTSAK